MRYKLVENSINNLSNPKYTVLLNRGVEKPSEYLSLDDSVLFDWKLLNNIEIATECLLQHIDKNSNIHILVDCDCDGYTSASMMYKYLKLINNNINLTYSIHTGKQHGISDDIEIPDNVNLLIIPDASTNDIKQCELLKNKGVDIIILDHHISDEENPHAIVVNNQMCNYPNKQLCGAGIVYKFLQAIDEAIWCDYADNFLDLCALGLIGDCMDIKSYETKRLIDKGLSNIKNKFFKALIEKQSYSINNVINTINVQFYIVPLINGMIRSGDYDEKDLMFRAFIETEEFFKYKKRGEENDIDEDIYLRAARLCSNAKARQNTKKDKSASEIDTYIEVKSCNKNRILFVNVTDILPETMTGVVAIKVAEKYNKPCVLLRKKEDGTYSGSARNVDGSPIEDLRSFLENTKLFTFTTGHPNAFGVGIKKENVPMVIEKTNELLKDVDFSHCYEVDFVIDAEELSVGFVKELDDLKDIYGQGIKEAYVTITGIEVDKELIQLMGKEKNTWKFIYNDEVSFVKFKVSEDDEILQWVNSWEGEDSLTIDIIGRCSINSFGGILTPQVIVSAYEIRKRG